MSAIFRMRTTSSISKNDLHIIRVLITKQEVMFTNEIGSTIVMSCIFQGLWYTRNRSDKPEQVDRDISIYDKITDHLYDLYLEKDYTLHLWTV